jgi:hypothetical protein
MPKYLVRYRDEFQAVVEAPSPDDAIRLFQNADEYGVRIECLGNCWPEFFEVFGQNEGKEFDEGKSLL